MRLDTVNLQKGDTLIVTVNSDELDRTLLKTLKKQFKKVFPKNKIAILGLSREDNLSLSVINTTKK